MRASNQKQNEKSVKANQDLNAFSVKKTLAFLGDFFGPADPEHQKLLAFG